MKTIHIFENAYYLIGNKAVAKCYLFESESDCTDFKTRIDTYLKPICSIISFGFSNDEFQLLVKVKSRDVIEKYFREKYVTESDKGEDVPETTYIFAQAMANLQSGYAKHFNYKYKRDGGLMCRRYTRELIETEEILRQKIEEVNKLEFTTKRSKIWTFRRKGLVDKYDLEGADSFRSSYNYYKNKELVGFEAFKSLGEFNVRGHFKKLPPKRLKFKNLSEKLKSLSYFFLWKCKT